jgi:hypothetical protein
MMTPKGWTRLASGTFSADVPAPDNLRRMIRKPLVLEKTVKERSSSDEKPQESAPSTTP